VREKRYVEIENILAQLAGLAKFQLPRIMKERDLLARRNEEKSLYNSLSPSPLSLLMKINEPEKMKLTTIPVPSSSYRPTAFPARMMFLIPPTLA
jgi:hypothetical protein